MRRRTWILSFTSVFIVMLIVSKQVFWKSVDVSTLQPATRTATFTRLGRDLKFQGKCPPNSIIENITYITPMHSDCPTLFVVGAPKAGTTTILRYVSMHPGFEGADLHKKGFGKGEIFYFTKHGMTWDQYKKHFPTGVVTGESTAWYLSTCEVPKRMFESCGRKAKVVMLLRNPIHRIVSHYVMNRMAQKNMQASIDEFVSSELKKYNVKATQPQMRIKDVLIDWNKQRCMPQLAKTNVIYFGLYYLQLMNWLCNFPAENIMIIQSEEFYSNPTTVVTQVLHFINLTSLSEENLTLSSAIYNKGNYDKFDTRISDKLLKELRDLYQPFNEALFELLSWNNIDWNRGM